MIKVTFYITLEKMMDVLMNALGTNSHLERKVTLDSHFTSYMIVSAI